MTAWAGFFSPLSANIYFPALNILASSLDVSSSDINVSRKSQGSWLYFPICRIDNFISSLSPLT